MTRKKKERILPDKKKEIIAKIIDEYGEDAIRKIIDEYGEDVSKIPDDEKVLKLKKRKEQYLQLLELSVGIKSTACQKMGISRMCVYKWEKDDPGFRDAVKDITEYAIDFVESALMKRIREGSDACIIFFMKTKGSSRGYSERIGLDFSRVIEVVKHDELADL